MIKILANEEFRKGDRPIATPIPIEIRVFVSISIKQRYLFNVIMILKN